MYKKEGNPEEGEVVICTVKRITPHAAFVELDEYGKEAMLHISEISSKWVKRIRDFVNVGSKIVCKVISTRNNMIDVSLRRVSSGERKRKLEEWKIENRLYTLINALSKAKRKTTTEKIIKEIVSEFGSLRNLFEEYKENKEIMEEVNIPKTWKSKISKIFDDLIKSSMVSIKKEIKINCFEGDGIERIRNLLKKMLEMGKDYNLKISYLSSPRYLIKLTAKDYKSGEKFLSNLIENISKIARKEKVEINA